MPPVRETIAANVRALLERDGGPLAGRERSGISRLMARGYSNGTAQRILSGETSLGIDLIEQLAATFGVQPWQLLIEGLDPRSPPLLINSGAAWPFPLADQAAYWSLAPDERAAVQGQLDLLIAQRQRSAA